MTDDLTAAHRALADPHTDATTLAQITQAFPELGPQAAAHPNAYPELVAWVQQYADALAQEHQQEALLAAAPPVAGSAITAVTTGAAAAAAQSATTSSAAEASADNAAPTPAPPRRRLLIPLLAGAAALLLATAGITTAVAVNQAHQAQSAAQHAADSADRAADPASGSGSRSGSASSNDGTARTDPTSPGQATSGSTAPSAGTGNAPVVSTGEGPAPVVLILDASGSMVRETTKGRTRMEDARDAMLKAVDDLPDGAQVALLVFGTGTGNSDAEQAAGCTDVKTVAKMGVLDRKALGNSIKAVKASGYTPIGPALRIASGLLPQHGAGTIVLVSDGVDTCSPPPACEVASELHGANGALAIHAVGFGVDKDEQAKQQLECIGRVGGGSYLPASNVSQLSSRITAATNGTDTAKTISADGFHDVRLGMTLDEVRARTTDFKVTKRQTVDGVEIVYVDCGWGTVQFRGGLATAIRPSDQAPTLDGLTVGDNTAHAAEIYGEPVSHGKDDLGNYQVYAVSTGSPYGYAVYGDGTIKRIVLCRCTGIAASTSLADWDITFAGIGPLRLGMTTKEMLAALPGSAGDATGSDAAPVTVQPLPSIKELSVTFSQGRIAAITVNASNTATVDELAAAGAKLPQMRGIRIGETTATLRNITPQGTSFVGAYATQDYVIATRTGVTLGFPGGVSEGPGTERRIHGFELVDSTVLEFPKYGDWKAAKQPPAAPATEPPSPTPAAKSQPALTSEASQQLLLPAGSCIRQPEQQRLAGPIQLQDGKGRVNGNSDDIAVSQAVLVGTADLNADGFDDAVLALACYCPQCNGRTAAWTALVPLDVSGAEPRLIGESIWASKTDVPGRPGDLVVDLDNNKPELDGRDILAYEVPLWGPTLNPGEAEKYSGWFRYHLSGGQWARSPK